MKFVILVIVIVVTGLAILALWCLSKLSAEAKENGSSEWPITAARVLLSTGYGMFLSSAVSWFN